MRAAIYLRVSTDEQTTDNQERELRAAAERMGHEIVAVYRDAGISGSKGRDRTWSTRTASPSSSTPASSAARASSRSGWDRATAPAARRIGSSSRIRQHRQ